MFATDGENITITRGDTARFCFQRHDNDGNVLSTRPSKMFFTIKKSNYAKDVIIQKTLNDFTMDEEAFWHVEITPEETEVVAYGTYKYDIEITEGTSVTTVSKGDFVIEEETTWRENKE